MVSKREASLKHAKYYAEVLLSADRLYERGGGHIEEGLKRFDDNQKNIELGQKWADLYVRTDEEAATLACEYPERGAHCLYLRQKPIERIAWLICALQVAHQRGFELVEGNLHNKIALALTEMGEYQQSIEHYSIRLAIAERLNDLDGLGEGACNLGILYDNLEMLEPAQECYQYALEIANQTSNQKILEVAIGNLGLIYLKQENYDRAMDCFQHHYKLARQNGDQWSEGNALTNLGIVCLKLEKVDEALTYLQQSRMINQKLGDLDGEAKSLGYIGSALVIMGKLDDATIAYEERIALAQKLNDHRGMAKGNWNLGKVLIKQRNYRAGLEYLYKCVEYEKSAGDPAWEDDLKVIKSIETAFNGAD